MARGRQQDIAVPTVRDGGGAVPNIVEMGGRVEERIDAMMSDGRLFLPPNYSPQNAMKSAELIIRQTVDRHGTPALLSCTKESIYNALLDMVVQGLNPGKKQCYFIAYGNQLLLQRSYMGTVAVAKRLGGIKDVHANVVYLDDDFEYEVAIEGGYRITKHVQRIENIDPDRIKAAYAVLKLADGGEYADMMTMAQIRRSWGQGAARGDSPAHRNFPDEMARKTVINRACKLFVNTSDDSDLISEAFTRTADNESPGGTGGQLPAPGHGYENENSRQMEALLFGPSSGEDAPQGQPGGPAPEHGDGKEPGGPDPTGGADEEKAAEIEAEIREVFGA
jgi:recombination protein RecT